MSGCAGKHRAHRVSWPIVAFLVIVFGPGLYEQACLTTKRLTLQRELRQLETTRQGLMQEHDRLSTDPVYVEGLIRSTFKVAKPDELVVPIRPEDLAGPSRLTLRRR